MKQLLFLFTLFTISVNAQPGQRIKFDYDTAGNQTRRIICLDCNARATDSIPKKITELNEEDLLKFSPEDVISYYPNPVKEELYLQWELTDDKNVTIIEIFSINGKLVKSLNQLQNDKSIIIQFKDEPSGTYSIVLNYSNGEKEYITIIKKD